MNKTEQARRGVRGGLRLKAGARGRPHGEVLDEVKARAVRIPRANEVRMSAEADGAVRPEGGDQGRGRAGGGAGRGQALPAP